MKGTAMGAGTPLIERSEGVALQAHYELIRDVHLRQLFADDATRGSRFTLDAAGIYLDYSRNGLTGETVRLLIALANACDIRGRIDAMSRGDKINVTERRA